LLAFSRRTPVAEASLAIGAVLNEAEELLRPLIPSSIRLEVHVSDAALRISADPTQLQQVLVNLVVNARDAMARDGGRLDVTARAIFLSRADAARLGLPKAGHYAEFAVSDTGDGMDEAVQARVFEPFYTTKPVGEGTGLGLATAYGIIEQCGGVIVVESVPGRGSTFRVMLPRCVDAGDEIVPDALAPLLSGAGTVLLAEDEASVRRMLARTLRDAGYVVIEAQDGAEALRLGRQQLDSVDAVVTDVEMPRLSGIDLARRLTRHRPDLPVLFISGTTPEELGIGDSDSPTGPLHFLAKPFSEERLLERLQEVLQR
jgi:CheY-like chemotaxis protein